MDVSQLVTICLRDLERPPLNTSKLETFYLNRSADSNFNYNPMGNI